MARYVFTDISETQNWDWPEDETTATIQCRGSTGMGAAGTADAGGGGSGGGAYARKDVERGDEDHLVVALDAPGVSPGEDGGDAWVTKGGTTICKASGSKAASGTSGGLGGGMELSGTDLVSDGTCIGDVIAMGGKGSDANPNGLSPFDGGCGGESGGNRGDGHFNPAELSPGHQAFEREAPPVLSRKDGKGGDGGTDGNNGADGTQPGGGGGGGGRNGTGGKGARGSVIIDCPAWESGLHGVGCCCVACVVESLAIPETLLLNITFDRTAPDGLGSSTEGSWVTNCAGDTATNTKTFFRNDAWMDLIEAACPIPMRLVQKISGTCCHLIYKIDNSVHVCGSTDEAAEIKHAQFLGTAPDGSYTFELSRNTACPIDQLTDHPSTECEICHEFAHAEPGEYILQAELEIDVCPDGTYELGLDLISRSFQYREHFTQPTCEDSGDLVSECGEGSIELTGGIAATLAASGTITGDWDASKLTALVMDGDGGSGRDPQQDGEEATVSIEMCTSTVLLPNPEGGDPIPFDVTGCQCIYAPGEIRIGKFAYSAVHAQIGF